MAKVELKQPVVAEIAELFNGAKGAVVVDYRCLLYTSCRRWMRWDIVCTGLRRSSARCWMRDGSRCTRDSIAMKLSLIHI